MFKKIFHKNELIALIIKNNYTNEGINFFTDNSSPQQIAFMKHPKDKVVLAHVHNEIKREVSITQETLILKKGKMRLDLYTEDKEYLESHIMEAGDIVFLASGGHGIKTLEEIEMIEVKQGPYLGENDKVRFPEIKDEEVIIND